MKDNEAGKPEEQIRQSTFSLDHQRRSIRIMKFLFAMFSIILILGMVFSMILNR